MSQTTHYVRADQILEGDIARVANKGRTFAEIVGELGDGRVLTYANPYSKDAPAGTFAPDGRYDLIEVQVNT